MTEITRNPFANPAFFCLAFKNHETKNKQCKICKLIISRFFCKILRNGFVCRVLIVSLFTRKLKKSAKDCHAKRKPQNPKISKNHVTEQKQNQNDSPPWTLKNNLQMSSQKYGWQRSANMISCGMRGTFLSKSTEADAGENVDYPHRNRN
jgi:hypothetical protein